MSSQRTADRAPQQGKSSNSLYYILAAGGLVTAVAAVGIYVKYFAGGEKKLKKKKNKKKQKSKKKSKKKQKAQSMAKQADEDAPEEKSESTTMESKNPAGDETEPISESGDQDGTKSTKSATPNAPNLAAEQEQTNSLRTDGIVTESQLVEFFEKSTQLLTRDETVAEMKVLCEASDDEKQIQEMIKQKQMQVWEGMGIDGSYGEKCIMQALQGGASESIQMAYRKALQSEQEMVVLAALSAEALAHLKTVSAKCEQEFRLLMQTGRLQGWLQENQQKIQTLMQAAPQDAQENRIKMLKWRSSLPDDDLVILGMTDLVLAYQMQMQMMQQQQMAGVN